MKNKVIRMCKDKRKKPRKKKARIHIIAAPELAQLGINQLYKEKGGRARKRVEQNKKTKKS